MLLAVLCILYSLKSENVNSAYVFNKICSVLSISLMLQQVAPMLKL